MPTLRRIPRPELSTSFWETISIAGRAPGRCSICWWCEVIVPLSQQVDKDLFWIRNQFLNSEERFGRIIVHGHNSVIDAEFHSNRINIDTGAFVTGRLSCLRIESDEALFNVHCFAGAHVGARRLYL
jgi:hypothetical protein